MSEIHTSYSRRHINIGLLRRAGEFLEKVDTQLGSFHLLDSNAQYEVLQVRLKTGARLTITPAASHRQDLYVLSGMLRCEDLDLQLCTGAQLTVEDLDEHLMFEAVVATRLLYVSTEHIFHGLSHDLHELRQLAVEVELKDGYTSEHCTRLQTLSYTTGKLLGLTPYQLYELDHGAYLHDVGKIKVPLEILNKPGKLKPSEWAIIKQHPSIGSEMLTQTFMKGAARIVEQHHERVDGSGYPYGLNRHEISIEALIVAVADTFDAITSNRVYQKARNTEEALAELERLRGVHYEREVVQAFKEAVKLLIDKPLP